MTMKRVRKCLFGAVTGAALLASAGITQAQDATDTAMPPAGMGAQSTMQYCVPGCVVGPMAGDDMHHGMGQGMMPMTMPHGMMGQPMMMPMMMAPGMMGQPMMMPMMPMMMAPGMTGQGMMGQGMMNQGMMNQGAMMAGAGASFDPDNVRPHLEHRLTMMGLPNLMLGSIEEQDDDTLVAEIVTRDGTLVQRLAIDRHNGALTPLE
jgi:hypothetical protein